jgi:hypothetical protein
MKRFFAAFVLTPAEQRVVILVLLLLVAAAWFKHRRDVNYEATAHPPAAASPSPDEK